MTVDRFGRSALYAALAALAWLPWALVIAPAIGLPAARATYLAAVTVVYIGALTPQRGRRIIAVVGSALAAGACVLAAHSGAELAVGLAVTLGVARSGFLYRAAPARAALTEAMLVGGGLLFARFLGGGSPPSTALAVWGFLLVQSLFFLVPGARPRPAGEPHADPFDAAYRHALALLDDP